MRFALATILLALAPHVASAAGGREAIPKSWKITIGAAGEPGEPLDLTGHVVDRSTHAPLANATVFVYHADASGRYNAKDNEGAEPRLCGMLRTNASGEYHVRTTMPGGYGGFAPHIHFEVSGSGIPRQLLFVNLHLKRPSAGPNPSPAVALPGSEPVTRGADGVLHCSHELVVESQRRRPLPEPPAR